MYNNLTILRNEFMEFLSNTVEDIICEDLIFEDSFISEYISEYVTSEYFEKNKINEIFNDIIDIYEIKEKILNEVADNIDFEDINILKQFVAVFKNDIIEGTEEYTSEELDCIINLKDFDEDDGIYAIDVECDLDVDMLIGMLDDTIIYIIKKYILNNSSNKFFSRFNNEFVQNVIDAINKQYNDDKYYVNIDGKKYLKEKNELRFEINDDIKYWGTKFMYRK